MLNVGGNILLNRDHIQASRSPDQRYSDSSFEMGGKDYSLMLHSLPGVDDIEDEFCQEPTPFPTSPLTSHLTSDHSPSATPRPTSPPTNEQSPQQTACSTPQPTDEPSPMPSPTQLRTGEQTQQHLLFLKSLIMI